MLVHTNSSSKLGLIKRYVFDQMNQEAVLVRQNHKRQVSLAYATGTSLEIGQYFRHHENKPPKGVDAYTVLHGSDYYTVY